MNGLNIKTSFFFYVAQWEGYCVNAIISEIYKNL